MLLTVGRLCVGDFFGATSTFTRALENPLATTPRLPVCVAAHTAVVVFAARLAVGRQRVEGARSTRRLLGELLRELGLVVRMNVLEDVAADQLLLRARAASTYVIGSNERLAPRSRPFRFKRFLARSDRPRFKQFLMYSDPVQPIPHVLGSTPVQTIPRALRFSSNNSSCTQINPNSNNSSCTQINPNSNNSSCTQINPSSNNSSCTQSNQFLMCSDQVLPIPHVLTSVLVLDYFVKVTVLNHDSFSRLLF